ncbi:MAG: hypothetical protein AAB250_14380, partial [Bdellovibrionota bacterium]
MRTLFHILVFNLVFALTAVDPSWAASVSGNELEAAVRAHRDDVPEFKFIIEHARKNGLRVWLFGGTAASFAHYAKWDLQRKKGDRRFQPNRFDYDYTTIYRSNQDLDIVIDGDPGKASELQSMLAKKFPHLQGQKSVWEVRLLGENFGEKEALLRNPDFSNQHTDSHSVGMIELTESNEPILRDLRDWSNPRPAFVQDVLAAKLHYYFSPLHQTTSRYKEGKNPPILSVARYFIKALQFELAMDSADVSQLKAIVDDFNPKKISDYERSWLIKNGPKLIQNAVDIEYAWNLLESTGLRQKLASIDDRTRENSLSFWMNKEPLRSQKVGLGRGATARQLGLTVVAHETSSFDAYESITRAHTGEPNVLISREKMTGESALYGDGFYTMSGREGARGSKITIRFTVDPEARENHDFVRVDSGAIIFHNKNALTVIPESLNFGFREYITFLRAGVIDQNERAALEKLKRRLNTRMAAEVTKADLEWFDKIVLEEMSDKSETRNAELLKVWVETRRPFRRGFDRDLMMKVMTAAHTHGLFTGLLRNVEPTRRRISVSLDEYMALYPRSESSESSDATLLSLFFEAPEPKTIVDLETIANRIKQEPRAMSTLIELWLRGAVNSELPFARFNEVLGEQGVLDRFKNLAVDHDELKVTRRLTHSQYVDLLERWPFPSYTSDHFEVRIRLKRIFSVPVATDSDTKALRERIERAFSNGHTREGWIAEWLDMVSPFHPEALKLMDKKTFRKEVGNWLKESDGKKFSTTLLRAIEFVGEDLQAWGDLTDRLKLTSPLADRARLRDVV